jgi:hypothetical protein
MTALIEFLQAFWVFTFLALVVFVAYYWRHVSG